MLPFGFRSAPKMFNAVADMLIWYLHQFGIRYIKHYLDNFIIIAPPDSQHCTEDLETLEAVCGELGVPLESHKKDGPSTRLSFLEIELDTVTGELRLPADKISCLQIPVAKMGAQESVHLQGTGVIDWPA